MKFYNAFLLFAGTAFAQTSLNDLPVCAQQAGLAAIDATGCPLTNLNCICNSVPFLNTLRAYISQHCSSGDTAAALTYGQSLCASVGVSISVTTTPGVTAAATTTVPTTALAGTTTSTMPPAVSPKTSVTVSINNAPQYVASTAAMPANGTWAGGMPAATYTGAANAMRCGGGMVVAGFVAVVSIIVV